MPDGVIFAAVFPTIPPAFKIIASIGSFIFSTAFLTESASETSPIIISKIFFPVSASRSIFASSAFAQELVYEQDHGVSFNKGTIDSDALIAIIQKKQEEGKFVIEWDDDKKVE